MVYGPNSMNSPLSLSQSQGVPSSPAGTTNLLMWTQEFDNAVWVKTSVTINQDADTDPDGGSTADSASFSLGGSVVQTSATSVGTGAPVSQSKSLTDSWDRFSVTGTFGGTQYTGSVYLRSVDHTGTINLRLSRAVGSGLLVFSILDSQSLGPFELLLWGAQLELGSSPPSTYVPRTT